MVIRPSQFNVLSIDLVGELNYDNHQTNTGHGCCGLGISFMVNSGCGVSTLKTYARHSNLDQTLGYANSNGGDRTKVAVDVQGVHVKEKKSKCCCYC